MRSSIFRSVLFFLLALMPMAFAQTTVSTYFMTRTVYRVNTVTMTGSAPLSAANSTSTTASIGTLIPIASTANGTLSVSAAPTASNPSTAPSAVSTGAASQMNVNAFVAAIAAGVAYMAL